MIARRQVGRRTCSKGAPGMRSRFVRSLALSLIAGSVSLSLLLPMDAAAMGADAADSPGVSVREVKHRDSCSAAPPGHMRCHAQVNLEVEGAQPPRAAPSAALPLPTGGLTPGNLQSAYNLNAPSGAPGSGRTVAIVDAFDDPNAEADLAIYRATFGLGACTSANGCFTKLNQGGATSPLPPSDSGWSEEISLDLAMVSATCPNCKILLVEANSNDWSDIFAAVNEAAALHPASMSNSYGAPEWGSSESYYASYYNHPGMAVTASTGDSGYGVEFPAASWYVTAVGGTSLVASATARGWTETAWTGGGAGCSLYITKPTWQHDSACPSGRTVADVAAVADPATGVAVYDTFNDGGWLVIGGTSAASPIVASVYALAGNTATISYSSYSYSHLGALFDIRSGSDGTCSPASLCTAVRGYDGPTGNGTPNGLKAF
jgi:subtilase family serine protease